MKKKFMICTFCMLLIIQSGCQSSKDIGVFNSLFPTETAVPTETAIPTATVRLTSTMMPTRTSLPFTPYPTHDPLDRYLPTLPEIPEGFQWALMEDMNAVMLQPDGWYTSRENCPLITFIGDLYFAKDELMQACIYKEDISETYKFSTGQTLLLYSDLEDAEAFALYLLGYLSQSDGSEMLIYDAESEDDKKRMQLDVLNIHTTSEVLKAFDYHMGDAVVHHLRVEAEYPYEDEADKIKIVQYSTIPLDDTVYLIVFETPKDQWDQVLEEVGLMLDYVVIFKD